MTTFTGFGREKNLKYSYLVTCPVDFSKRIPTAVSLTQDPTVLAENKLMVINNQPIDGIKKSFGVCCKFLFFEDRKQVIRFIEWVEMLRILGVEKITISNKHIHPEHHRILKYYEKTGFIEYTDYREPSGDFDFTIHRQRESIENLVHTDCYYRNRNL
jgi:hypothetical protein